MGNLKWSARKPTAGSHLLKHSRLPPVTSTVVQNDTLMEVDERFDEIDVPNGCNVSIKHFDTIGCMHVRIHHVHDILVGWTATALTAAELSPLLKILTTRLLEERRLASSSSVTRSILLLVWKVSPKLNAVHCCLLCINSRC